MLELRSPSSAPCSQQQQADADSVSALLEASGFAAVPPDGLAAPSTAADAAAGAPTAEEAEHTSTKSRDRSAASSALQGAATAGSVGQGRLQEVKGMLLEQQQLASAAEAKAKADAAARAAAEAAAKKKPYKYVPCSWALQQPWFLIPHRHSVEITTAMLQRTLDLFDCCAVHPCIH